MASNNWHSPMKKILQSLIFSVITIPLLALPQAQNGTTNHAAGANGQAGSAGQNITTPGSATTHGKAGAKTHKQTISGQGPTHHKNSVTNPQKASSGKIGETHSSTSQ